MFKIYRPSRSPEIPTPEIIYPKSMVLLGQGYALWYPEPQVTGEPQIGDVGYISGGAFVRLFNINSTAPDGHKVTYWDAPFEVVPPLPPTTFRIDRRHNVLGPGRFCSHGVHERETRGSISVAATAEAAAALSAGYTCREVQGALLVLQSHATAETIFESADLKRHMVRQHEHWCAFVRDTVRVDVRPEEIVLVSGWAKSSADWAAAVFSNTSTRHEASLQAQIGRFVGLELFHSRARTLSGPRVPRQGSKYPRRADTDEVLSQDQCMFVKRYRLKKRLGVLHHIVAGAGYDEPPVDREGGHDEGGAVTDETEPEGVNDWLMSEKPVDPLEVLLDYVLEVCAAKYAIGRDEDIESIIGGNEWPIDFATYLRKSQPPVEVEDDYASVSLPDLIAQEQKTLERRRVTSMDLEDWPRLSHEGCASFHDARATFPWGTPTSNYVSGKWAYLKFADPTRPAASETANRFALSHDGTLLAASWQSWMVWVWRTRDGLKLQQLEELLVPIGFPEIQHGAARTISALAFSVDDARLASGWSDGSVLIWNVHTGEEVIGLAGHSAAVATVTYTPDGARIITGSIDGAVKVWDARTGSPICTYAYDDRIEDFVFSRNGTRLAVKMRRGIAIYDMGSPMVQLVFFQVRHSDVIADLAFSPDGDRMVVVDNVGSARLYRTDGGEEPLQLHGHQGQIRSCAFSPDGNEVLTGSYDCSVIGHSAHNGAVYRTHGIGTAVLAVSYSPDGVLTAAAARDGKVAVYNSLTAEFVVELMGPVTELSGLKWLPDGRRLLSYAREGPLVLWNIGDVLRVRGGRQE